MSNQIPLLERLLLIHEHQITFDLMPFHKSLEKSFQTMKREFHLKYQRKPTYAIPNSSRYPYKGIIPILINVFRCLRKMCMDPEGTSLGSSSSLRQNGDHKRARPVSWMESSNTLASISNYGGSECSLAERGRRR